ncbi:MAG: DUF3108 domain-containing protein [Verrucomicrobiales bacterium]
MLIPSAMLYGEERGRLSEDHRAVYHLGWSGVPAARVTADVLWFGPELRLVGRGQTMGIARGLFTLDAAYHSHIRVKDFLPVHSVLEETYPERHQVITLDFSATRAVYRRVDTPADEKHRVATLRHANIRDLFSGLMAYRARPLREGDVETLVVCQGDRLYLATLQVDAHRDRRIAGRVWPTIECSLKLERILDDGSLEPHKKFKSASAWLTNDHHRHLLRIEAQVFVGKIFAELRTLEPLTGSALEEARKAATR